MRTLIIGLLLLLLSTPYANGQTKREEDKIAGKNWVITPGYYRTHYHIAELTLGRSYSSDEYLFTFFRNYAAGTEFLFDKNKLYLCPKVALEYSVLIFCVRANLLYITDFSAHGLIFRPEIGLSGAGTFNITYSYSFDSYNVTPLAQTHGLHLQWNFFAGGRNSQHHTGS